MAEGNTRVGMTSPEMVDANEDGWTVCPVCAKVWQVHIGGDYCPNGCDGDLKDGDRRTLELVDGTTLTLYWSEPTEQWMTVPEE